MGKPLSRPDCLRQNPRCLKKGDDEEAYIEDCYVPQRSIYDTMRINEQIDQGAKISQPSRCTLGSGGGEGSTLSSNGTLGADIGGVFVARGGTADVGVKKLDERVIFDALKLTSDPQSMTSVGVVGSSVIIPASNSAAVGAAVVTKRRHQCGDKKDNPNRRSWKAFMPPTYPEFAERLELSPIDSGEKRLSMAGIPVSSFHQVPSIIAAQSPAKSTSPLSSCNPPPVSSIVPHTPPVCTSSIIFPSISPTPHQPLNPISEKKSHHHPKQFQPLASPKTEGLLQTSPLVQSKLDASISSQPNPNIHRQDERKKRENIPTVPPLVCLRSVSEEPHHWDTAGSKTSDSELDSPLLESDQDTVPLIPPKPIFCPPAKARTWPRSSQGGKMPFGHGGVLQNLPILPPLPPLLGEDSDLDEESLYLLNPPSPFLQEEQGQNYEGLPLSPYVDQEEVTDELLGWPPPTGELRQRTASELCFEEDERRIMEELDGEEKEYEKGGEKKEERERLEMEERNWQAVLKLESHEVSCISWGLEDEEFELQNWETKQLSSSSHRPLLTPPVGFGGSEAASVSPCLSSEVGSDDLFLELERQCMEEEKEVSSDPEPDLVSVHTEPLVACCTLPRVEEEENEEDHLKNNRNEGSPLIDLFDSQNLSEPCIIEPFILLTDPNLKSADHTPSQAANRSRDHSLVLQVPVRHDEDHLLPLLDVDLLEGPLLESDSSGIQTSQLDRTAVADSKQSISKRAESDSDIGSEASFEQELGGREKAMEYNAAHEVHTSGSYKNLPPCFDNSNTDVNNCEMDTSESHLIDVAILQASLGDSELSSDLDMRNNGNNSDTIGHIFDASVDVKEVTNPEEMLSLLEIQNNLLASPEISTGVTSMNERESTEICQRAISPPKLDNSIELASVPLNQNQFHSSSTLSISSIQRGSNEQDDENNNTDVFTATDSFVYLAVAAPPQCTQECPPSPSVESTPPSPLPKPCLDPEEGSFLSSDSFVYLAAPERIPCVSDGGSACEDSRDLDSGSETSHIGVDFFLGSVTGDSDWDSDVSRPNSVHPCQEQWDQLELGLLNRLFSEDPCETGTDWAHGSSDKDFEVICGSVHSLEDTSTPTCFESKVLYIRFCSF